MRAFHFIPSPSSVILLLLGVTCAGCGLGAVLGKAVPQNTGAMYSGLAGQSVGILVWADRGIMIDWGTIQLDLANSVYDRLTNIKAEEVKDTKWPYPPASYVKYM